MNDFARLRKGNSIDKLAKALESQGKSFQKDERFWEPQVDKAGNGFATIRFLDSPKVDGEDGQPYVMIWTHGFKGPSGKWYIENSLTTLGQDDPVSTYNTKLWDSGIEANKKIARDQKRKLLYVSNILVVKDPANPENEGKVFLFRYGKKIFDKLREKMGLDEQGKVLPVVDPDETRFNPYHFWEGANFKLKARKVEGYRNYDKSEFEAPAPVSNDDNAIKELWEKSYSLKEVVAPKNFKTYEELEKRLNMVLGLTSPTTKVGDTKTTTSERLSTTAESVQVPDDDESEVESTAAVAETVASSDDDDAFAEYRRLAAD